MRAEMGEQQILAHGKVRHDGLAAPILRDKSDAGADRLGRRARRERLSLVTHFAPGAGTQAEERLDRLGASGADKPAEAQDLPAMQVERNVAHHWRRTKGANG